MMLADSCGQASQPVTSRALSSEFRDYWFNGKAELTRYTLQQARYGEIRDGEAVLIFVTEDFLPDKQVKYEHGDRPSDVSTVLKLNFTRKFFTGIYPYSMMSSVFTPVENPAAPLKISTSVQEWCGHTYMQLNKRGNQYKGLLHSYFQSEADQEFSIDALPEDALWNLIRLNPKALPTGDIILIPGTQYLRLRHHPTRPEHAQATKEAIRDTMLSVQPLIQYRIAYTEVPRTLEITFEQDFPYGIVAWQEETESGFDHPQTLTTRAVRANTIRSAYWEQNAVKDSVARQELGVDEGLPALHNIYGHIRYIDRHNFHFTMQER